MDHGLQSISEAAQLREEILSVLAEYGYPPIVVDGLRTGAGRAWWSEYLNRLFVDLEAIASAVYARALSGELQWAADCAKVMALGDALGFAPLAVELEGASYHFPEGERGWQAVVENSLSVEAVRALAADAPFLQDLLTGCEGEDRMQRAWCWFTARTLGFPAIEAVEAGAEAWQWFLLMADADALARMCVWLRRLREAQPLFVPTDSEKVYGTEEQEAVAWVIETSSAETKQHALEYLVASETSYRTRLRYAAALEGVVRLLGIRSTNLVVYEWSRECPDLTPVLWHMLALLAAERMGYPELGEGVWHIGRGYTPWSATIRDAERGQAREWFLRLKDAHSEGR